MINDKGQLIILNDYRNGDYAKSKLRNKIKDLTEEERRLNLIAVSDITENKDEEGEIELSTSFNVYNDPSNWYIIDSGTSSGITNSGVRIWATDRSEYDNYISHNARKFLVSTKKQPNEQPSEMSQDQMLKELLKYEKEREKKEKLKKEIKTFQVEIFIEKLIKHALLIGPRNFDTIKFIWNGDQNLFWTGNSTVIAELNNSIVSSNEGDASGLNRGLQVADYRTYWDEIIYEFDNIKKQSSGFQKLLNVFTRKMKKLTGRADETFASEDPVKIMTLFKDALENLDASEEQIKKMEEFIIQLSKGKSAPMVARACQKLLVTGCEVRLLQDGKFTKYVSEQQAVEFIKKSKRGLALDLMIDFPRAIPTEVIAKFEEAEKLQVFDQYLILHYKPESERPRATHTKESAKQLRDKEIKKETARKRDPILFGLIRGSRKLYYIADWIDEKCDLTLEKMMSELGQEAFEL